MPLTRISIRDGRTPAYKRAIMDGLYAAMRETFAVPDDDRFMIITEHKSVEYDYGATYLGIERSDDLAIIQITASDTRDVAAKKALFAAIARNLAADPGLRPQDVFINLVEVRPENWSFGDGLAQYATGP